MVDWILDAQGDVQRGLCYWAVTPDSAADHIARQLSRGEHGLALVTLHASAVGLGTMLPEETEEVDPLARSCDCD